MTATQSQEPTSTREPRTITPWRVAKANGAGVVTLVEADAYDSLALCETRCRAAAVANPGVAFFPIKMGRSVIAEAVTEVKVRRE